MHHGDRSFRQAVEHALSVTVHPTVDDRSTRSLTSRNQRHSTAVVTNVDFDNGETVCLVAISP